MSWTPIPNSDNYEVNRAGEVRRLPVTQRVTMKDGTVRFRPKAGRVLKPRKHNQGYRFVSITMLDGTTKQRTIHSLVMETFVGPRPNGLWINHKNGDKTDNRLENLEYCTASDNQRHAVATGLAPKPPLRRGTDNDHKCKLTEDQVRQIRADYTNGAGIARMARQYAVGESTIRHIVQRTSWAWLD